MAIFAGPSLDAPAIHRAWEEVDADLTVLPPIEQGDILRLGDLPDVIGIVDGAFFHAPAVLHREILFALERGAYVLGAASLGALRAAELDAFGMEGIGEIYRLYRSGRIDGDDEVAVAHAPASEGYRSLTESLVSIRHNLRRAQRWQVIADRTAASLVRGMKRLHFTQRTAEALLAATPIDERPALARFLEQEAIDLKRHDALLLVQTVTARLRGTRTWPDRVPVRVNQTSHFWRHRRAYEGRAVGDLHLTDDLVLGFQRLLSPSFRALYRTVARRCLAVDEAAHRGLVVAEDATLLARFAADRGSDPTRRSRRGWASMGWRGTTWRCCSASATWKGRCWLATPNSIPARRRRLRCTVRSGEMWRSDTASRNFG